MKIGFIGAGVVAQTISKHVLAVGHRVLLSNTRGPDSLAPHAKELGSGAEAGTPQQATEQDIVVLAANWPNVQQALFSIPDWKGRILVDATNRLAGFAPLTLGDISGRTSSEIVADLTPGARVVKAFNSVPMAWISDFSPSKPRTYASPVTTTKPRSRSKSLSNRLALPPWISARWQSADDSSNLEDRSRVSSSPSRRDSYYEGPGLRDGPHSR